MRLRRIFWGLLLLPLAGILNAQMIGASPTGPLPPNVPVIPTTIKNAPFSAVVITQYDRVMGSGNHIHRETRGRVYRDDQGRVRTETEFATPGGEQLLRVTIMDPLQHTVIHLDPRNKVATVTHTGQTVASNESALPPRHGISLGVTPITESGQPAGPPTRIQTDHSAANAGAAVKTANLGSKSIEGVDTVGTKTTRTIAAGAMGNEQPIVSVTDSWYSRDLQIVVLNETDDGQSGHNSMKLIDIVRAEPNSQLFLIPQDYSVKESNTATASAKP
ncbi:MAG: hypothetical protein WCC87_09785 [Candidatus Korobacteraceae bacterium]